MQAARDRRENFIPATIALNVAVFAQWHPFIPPNHRIIAGLRSLGPNAIAARRAGVPTYLFDHFTLSAYNLRHGRWWTLLTNAFSHRAFLHLASNMISFSFAVQSGFDLGMDIWNMTALAVGSALTGSVAILAHEKWVIGYRHNVMNCSFGASGMVNGLLVGTMLCDPRRTMYHIGKRPVEMWEVTALCLAGDACGLLWQANNGVNGLAGETRIGHAAHLGGALFGAAYWWLFLRSRRTRSRKT